MLSQIPLSLMRRWILFCVLLPSSALSIKATRSPKSNFIAPGSPSCCSYALKAAVSFNSEILLRPLPRQFSLSSLLLIISSFIEAAFVIFSSSHWTAIDNIQSFPMFEPFLFVSNPFGLFYFLQCFTVPSKADDYFLQEFLINLIHEVFLVFFCSAIRTVNSKISAPPIPK